MTREFAMKLPASIFDPPQSPQPDLAKNSYEGKKQIPNLYFCMRAGKQCSLVGDMSSMGEQHAVTRKTGFWIAGILTVLLLAVYVLASTQVTRYDTTDLGLLTKLPITFWMRACSS